MVYKGLKQQYLDNFPKITATDYDNFPKITFTHQILQNKIISQSNFSVESATQETLTYNADLSGNRDAVQNLEQGDSKQKFGGHAAFGLWKIIPIHS